MGGVRRVIGFENRGRINVISGKKKITPMPKKIVRSTTRVLKRNAFFQKKKIKID